MLLLPPVGREGAGRLAGAGSARLDGICDSPIVSGLRARSSNTMILGRARSLEGIIILLLQLLMVIMVFARSVAARGALDDLHS